MSIPCRQRTRKVIEREKQATLSRAKAGCFRSDWERRLPAFVGKTLIPRQTNAKEMADEFGHFGKSVSRRDSKIGNPYLFQGRRWNPESKFYYYRNRYYDSGKGRFITRDPMGIWFDAMQYGNGYSGFSLNTFSYIDPYGYEGGLGKGIGGMNPQSERHKRIVEKARKEHKKGANTGSGEFSLAPIRLIFGAYKKAFEEVTSAKTGDVEAGIVKVDGIVFVECCDESGDKHRAKFSKTCYGAYAGMFVSAHILSGTIRGVNCPEGYEGGFWEWSIGTGVFGPAYSGGISDKGTTGATGASFGGGLPVSLIWCDYKLLNDEVAKEDCDCETAEKE